jgi:hypothetical protein
MLDLVVARLGQKISGQLLRARNDKMTIHRASYAVKAQLLAGLDRNKFFNSLDMNYLRPIDFLARALRSAQREASSSAIKTASSPSSE